MVHEENKGCSEIPIFPSAISMNLAASFSSIQFLLETVAPKGEGMVRTAMRSGGQIF